MDAQPGHHPAAGDVDPDVRFLLANERTLLAWIRTGLTLQAGGVLLVQFGDVSLGAALGTGLLAVGIACHLVGWRRYRLTDRAVRAGRLPARGIAVDLIVWSAVALALAVAVALLAGRV